MSIPFWIRFDPPMPMHEAIKTPNAPEPRGHYSQAVRAGSFLFVSGQLPIDRNGNVVKGTMAEEAGQALENIRAILEAADGSIADIVQCTIYISDIVYWTEVNGIYGAFFFESPGTAGACCGAGERDALWRSHRDSSDRVLEPRLNGTR